MSLAFDAWHLPGVDIRALATLALGDLTVRYPEPTPELIASTIAQLGDAGERLREHTVTELVEVIDAAAGRLLDPEDAIRGEAIEGLSAAGYSRSMAARVVDGMARDWRADRLRRLLDAELGDPAVLDELRPAGDGRRTRAYGPRLAYHVFSGNVPGVAVTSLVRALLVKAPSLGKLAADGPVLPVLFARAVSAVAPTVGRALAVTYWPGGLTEPEQQAVRAADTVIVYGGEEVVASYRDRVREDTRLVVHGPRFSVGLVSRSALDRDLDGTARSVARAVAMFDQQGCVSPHAVWVETGGETGPEDLADAVARALQAVEDELPRGRLSPAEASAIQQERTAAELKGHQPGGPSVRVLTGDGTRWTVIYDSDPAFVPSCLNRLVRIHPVDGLDEAVDRLAPVGRYLQSVAVAAPDPTRRRLVDRLARVGVTRITTFDRLPWPPPDWHHDGQEPLRELLRWVDLES